MNQLCCFNFQFIHSVLDTNSTNRTDHDVHNADTTENSNYSRPAVKHKKREFLFFP